MKKFQAILFFTLLAGTIFSQAWTTYTTNNGLVNNDINAIAIDRQGNKWFGTDYGVSKFDGTNWITIKKENGLVDNDVNCITTDKQGNIWFGTYFGVSKFDGATWTSFKKSNGLIDNNVLCITFDSLGNTWFGTNYGISKFNGTTWTNYSKNDGLVDNSVTCITIDAKGNKWIGTMHGVSKFDDTSWKSYTNADGLVNNWVHCIAIDKNENLWFGTNNGIAKYDGSKWTKILSVNTYGLESDDVKDIFIDAQGNIWFCTMYGGIALLNDGGWQEYTTADGLVNNRTEVMAIDSQNNKWFCTRSGISKFKGTLSVSSKSLNINAAAERPAVLKIISDTAWTISCKETWLTLNKTSGKYNDSIIITASANSNNPSRKDTLTISNGIKTHKMIIVQEDQLYIYTNSRINGTVNSTGILSIYSNTVWKIKNKEPWLKLNQDTGRYDAKILLLPTINLGSTIRVDTIEVSANSKIEKVAVIQQPGNTEVWPEWLVSNARRVTADKDNNIWFLGIGVSKLDVSSNFLREYDCFEDPGSPCNSRDIAIDSKGNKWFTCGTVGNTIIKFNDTTWTNIPMPDGYTDECVDPLAIDKKGKKWFASRKGAFMFNDTAWTVYTKDNGLVANEVNTIFVDVQNNIWFGTEGGISKFDGVNWSNYTKADGLAYNNVTAIAVDTLGTKWFGTNSGDLSKFDGQTWLNYRNEFLGYRVNVIFIDEYGNKWIGTNNGVAKFNGTTWVHYTKRNGLMDNNVTSITIDGFGNKWFGTNGGFSKLAAGAIVVSTNNIDFTDNTRSSTVTIMSDFKWKLEKQGSWYSVSGTSGDNDAIITISANANTNAASRIDTIIISNDLSIQKIVVRQNGTVGILQTDESNEFKLYPNPVTERISISLPVAYSKGIVELYTLNGSRLQIIKATSNYAEIDMKKYPAGLYLLKFYTENGVITKKFIKQ